MKNFTKSFLAAALAVAAFTATAQDADRPTPPEGGARPPRPVPPLMAALDANQDGVLDATEIDNAVAALKALDKNGDGQLTREEIHPKPPGGGRGPGHAGGPGGPGRPEGRPGGRRGEGRGEGRPPRPAPAPAPAE